MKDARGTRGKSNVVTSQGCWRLGGVDVQPVLLHGQQSSCVHTAVDIIDSHHGRLVLLYAAQLAQLGNVARHHKRALREM